MNVTLRTRSIGAAVVFTFFALGAAAQDSRPASRPVEIEVGTDLSFGGEGETIVKNAAGEVTWSQKTLFDARMIVLERAPDGGMKVAWITGYGLAGADLSATGVSILSIDASFTNATGLTDQDLTAKGIVLAAPGYSSPILAPTPGVKVFAEAPIDFSAPLRILGETTPVAQTVTWKTDPDSGARTATVRTAKVAATLPGDDQTPDRTFDVTEAEITTVIPRTANMPTGLSAKVHYREGDQDVTITMKVRETARRRIAAEKRAETAAAVMVIRDASLQFRRAPGEHEMVDAYLNGFAARFPKSGLAPVAERLRNFAAATAVNGGHVHEPRCMIGATLPEFTLNSPEGKPWKTADLAGHPAVVAFFGVGCEWCRMEAPHLSKIAAEYAARGVRVVAVNGWDESADTVRGWAGKNAIKHTLLMDGSALARDRFYVASFPVTFFVDAEGTIRDVYNGFGVGVEKTLRERLDRVIAAVPARR